MFFIILFSLSLLLVTCGFFYYQLQKNSAVSQPSNYEIYIKNPLNQPSYYPVNQSISPGIYQPTGLWTGRLILAAKEQNQISKSVLFEVYNADPAYQDLVGKIVNLQWSNDPQVQAYIKAVTQDVKFTQAAEDSKKRGNLHPDRLNNLKNVDPLQSLAGLRPEDDVIVSLNNPVIVSRSESDRPTLIISQEPVQITGRAYTLVKIIQPENQGSDRFLVRHYNQTSQQFDGIAETIRIPQVPADRNGVRRSTNRGIENSPLNNFGWYIYGAKDQDEIFVAQAIEPRAIMRLQPDDVRLGRKAGLDYINQQLWKNTPSQKGTAKTVLLDPNSNQNYDAISKWREGDRAILIHTYGGIGGTKPEGTQFGLVTGHFAYGIASVLRDRFTNELRFDIEYQQVYAHNPDGIVAGKIKWSSYMGDLQRGWLGNRPVSDVIVKLDAVSQDYDFDGIKLSPIGEFTRQLEIMMARYRIGDGTGAAVVTPATSCVQDANQVLYVTIKRIAAEIQSNQQIQDWLRRHPQHPQTLRFQKLVELGRSLENQLAPLGIVRSDWQKNAGQLAGTRSAEGIISTLGKSLTSWRTILPRRAHDEISSIFLKNGASLWIIRTNQVGGFNPDIAPLAPTALLGNHPK